MSGSKGWVAGVLLAVASAGLTHPAGAVSLMVGQTLVASGLSISVVGCSVVIGGGPASACTAGSYEMVAGLSAGETIRIRGAGGGAIFNSIAAGSGLYDLSVDLEIQGLIPAATVNKISLAMAGSTNLGATTASKLAVSVGENTSAPGASSMTVNLNGPLTSSSSFAPFSPFTTPFVVNKDIKLSSSDATAGDTLTLSYVSQGFLPAPEPVSIGLFLLGVGGLGIARRYRRTGASRTP
jgi:hypothetical protein